LISAVAGYLVIAFFLGVLRRIGMLPFLIYRLGLGLLLLAFYFSGLG
jgi:undecaprenyl-diphosphatase